MSPKFNFIKSSLILLIFTISLSSCSSSKRVEEKTADLKDFKVIVTKTDDGIKLQSVTGSAWIDLAFRINHNQEQAIDEYGMTELNKVSSEKNKDLADYLFTISKTENKIMLKGVEGTAWTELSFYLDKDGKQAFNQFGMTNLN
ncbi:MULTISPECIES: hypothetical protein [Flavobacteriaceae]|uniref:hypothetical protein n=1 Tax=Flavobacteriaceae TaxID=49546 RepID=UPI0003FFF4D5|nr:MULTISPECIES: hypothetical protein [Flavobacteriaceae]MDX1279280.1 hypothetical protein [Oceanihabitans sediminis]